MNRNSLLRLARLESSAAVADQSSLDVHNVRKKKLMAIVAAHQGKWQEPDSFAEAFGRALGLTPSEVRCGFAERADWIWEQTVGRLEDLLESHSRELASFDSEAAWLLSLYDAIPDPLKSQAGLFPLYSDYLV